MEDARYADIGLHAARLFRRDFFNQLAIPIKLITFDRQFVSLRWMVREVCDNEVDHEKGLALRRYFKSKLNGADRVLYRRAAAGFFEDGADRLDFDIKRVERASRNLAAKNTRGFFSSQLSQIDRIGRGSDFLPSGAPELKPGSRAEKNFVDEKFDLTEITDGFPMIRELNLQHAARVFGAERGHGIQPEPGTK